MNRSTVQSVVRLNGSPWLIQPMPTCLRLTSSYTGDYAYSRIVGVRMTLLITALLTLFPLTASAEFRGGVAVGPSTVPHAGSIYSLGTPGFERQTPEPHFPHVRGRRGRAIWPMIGSAMGPNLTIIDVQVESKEGPPPPPPKPSAPAKFWTARCGSFVELQVSPTMNLIEEEQKGCPN